MNRRHAITTLATLLASHATADTRGASSTLAWEASVRGVRTLLSVEVTGGRAEGALQEGGVTLAVRGTLQGSRLQAGAHDPASGQRLLRLDGRIEGDDLLLTVRPDAGDGGGTVTLRRVGAAPAGSAAGGRIDPAFVGRWHHESQINSPGGAGGFASFNTVRTLELGEDGRARQWVRSAGGGGQWSHSGGQTLEFSGRWQVRGGELWVALEGESGFQRVAAIRRAGDYLITETGGQRLVWRR
jgi:hypothetical protein